MDALETFALYAKSRMAIVLQRNSEFDRLSLRGYLCPLNMVVRFLELLVEAVA
jgi:hypothetical protein